MSTQMEELVARFKQEAAERCERIETLSRDDTGASLDRIREEAHKIKGAAGMLGFPALKERAAVLEDLAASGTSLDQVQEAVGELRAELPD